MRRLLLLVNYRPEYRHEWGQKTYYTQLRLAPFGKAEAEEFLDCFLLGDDASLTGLKHLILEKTEGTPFFMEEVVQTLVEEGPLTENGAISPGATPRPRCTFLPPCKGCSPPALTASRRTRKLCCSNWRSSGASFRSAWCAILSPSPKPSCIACLPPCSAKSFSTNSRRSPRVEYRFKHALTQEVAYGTVLQERRKVLHERTGQAMEELYAAALDEHYSDLAHHYQSEPQHRAGH